MKGFIYTIFLCIVLAISVRGAETNGNVYWVQFNSKVNSPYSLNKPSEFLSLRAIERRAKQGIYIDSTDFPVNPLYVNALKALGFYVKHTSRWMNGAIVVLPESINIESIKLPSFVVGIELRKGSLKSASTKFSERDSSSVNYYGYSFQQVSMLGGDFVHNFSMGKGVHIAVIDAGFQDVDTIMAFENLRSRNGILGTFDFVKPGNNVYKEHSHGTNVLSIMSSKIEGSMVGTAPEASYWLLRSEDGAAEYPAEEDYWIIAAEFADSVGCNVINTSLGYSVFENPAFNHTYDQLDGNTLRISKAANIAVEKGIVVVCSAGNSGNEPWKHINAPSDAKKVLSVAAIDASGNVTAFSSLGFENASVPKPDITAMGAMVTVVSGNGRIALGNGTSYSSPLVAGMAACLVAIYPKKTAAEIIEMIRTNGDRFPFHSVEYGYGVPNFEKIISTNPIIIDSTTVDAKPVSSVNNVLVYPNPFNSAFHITSDTNYPVFELYTLKGAKLFSTNIEVRKEISPNQIPNFNKGVYFAVFKGITDVKTIKLIYY